MTDAGVRLVNETGIDHKSSPLDGRVHARKARAAVKSGGLVVAFNRSRSPRPFVSGHDAASSTSSHLRSPGRSVSSSQPPPPSLTKHVGP